MMDNIIIPGNRTAKPQARHIIFVIDISGSMSGNLQKIGENLQSDIVRFLNPGDKLSAIGFSGREQVYPVFEHETIESLSDVKRAKELIQKQLRPVGLTGFKDPLQYAQKLVKDGGLPTIMSFMSDGMDNQSSAKEIEEAARELGKELQGAVVVEYGRWADRSMLTRIAEHLGGIKETVEGEDEFVEKMHHVAQGQTIPRVEVQAAGASYVGIIENGQLTHYPVEEGVALVPEGSKEAYAFRGLPDLRGVKPEGQVQNALYAHLALQAGMMNIDGVIDTLKQLGDTELIKDTATLFGKQRFTAFEQKVRQKLANEQERYQEGFDPSAMPADDAATILDVLDIIQDQHTRVLIRDEAFTPKRISRATQETSLEEEAKEAQEALKQATASGDGEQIKKAKEQVDKLLNRAQAQATFEEDSSVRQEGLRVDGIVTDESRANISLRFRIPGKVRFQNSPAGIPGEIESFRYRNHNVILSGVTTLDQLPIRPSQKALENLQALGLAPQGAKAGERLVIELSKLAVINRQQAQAPSAQELAEISIKIEQKKADLKVLNEAYKRLFPPKTSEGMAERFGAENASWLRGIGLTDGGFNPPRSSVEPTDELVVTELQIKAKGLSSLPSVKEVMSRAPFGQKAQTSAGTLMCAAIETLLEYNAAHPQTPPLLGPEAVGTAEQKTFLEGLIQTAKEELKVLKRQLEQIRMSILVAGRWFTDLPDDQTVTAYGIPVTISTREDTIKI